MSVYIYKPSFNVALHSDIPFLHSAMCYLCVAAGTAPATDPWCASLPVVSLAPPPGSTSPISCGATPKNTPKASPSPTSTGELGRRAFTSVCRVSFRGARHSPPLENFVPHLGNCNPSKLNTAHCTRAPPQNVFWCAFAPPWRFF